jgi:hypothetical protein
MRGLRRFGLLQLAIPDCVIPAKRLAMEVGSMLRDIDYAATAVKTALVEKYGREILIEDLQVKASEHTISVQQGERIAAGTRDMLISCIHKASSYDQFWRMCSETPSRGTTSIRR